MKASLVTVGLSTLGLSLVSGLGLLTLGIQAASAQISSPTLSSPSSISPLDPLGNNRPDPFSSRGDDQAKGVMDLINRAVLGPSRSADEFNVDQQESLDSATAEFRKLQLERLRGQQQAAPAAAPATPTQP